MNLYQIFYQYFIYPVIGYQYKYNIYNTFLYGLLFVVGFILFYYLFVKNKKIIIDRYFLLDLIILTLIFIIYTFIRIMDFNIFFTSFIFI